MTHDDLVRDVPVQFTKLASNITPGFVIQAERQLHHGVVSTVDRANSGVDVAVGESFPSLVNRLNRTAVEHGNQLQRCGGEDAVFHVVVVGVHKFLIDGFCRSLSFFLALLLLGTPHVHGQNQAMTSSIAKMQAAVEKQRAAAKRQVGAADATSGFFTTPWSGLPAAGPLASAPPSFDDSPCDPVSSEDLRSFISEAAAKEGLNPMLLRAVIHRESGGKACAVSHKGAQGLMQLMPDTAADLGVADPFDAKSNVLGGAKYLKQMLQRYQGDVRLALAAYNAGPQRVPTAGPIPAIAETQAYVAAIMSQLGVEEQ